ncbi:gamma-butyrobetaine hydroxylase [Crucibulum laeve]|uniref:Gamma-butyrobetaine hydroxylase n=1 Tax=Crucibulum laeve TaxID=68775 RepID=A0A5C3MAB2_9AGAR|nr:gamma-butyrobetaine hydroxylase [Crucibulum laeve]
MFFIPRSLTRVPSLLHSTRSFSSISTSDTAITVHTLKTTFPYLWLRDACQAPSSVHPSNRQKLFRSSDIPLDIRPAKDGMHTEDGGLRIRWEDGHESFFERAFLERHSSLSNLTAFHKDVSQQPWTRDFVTSQPSLFISYASLKTPQGLADAITQLSSSGLLFIRDVPNTETSNATCELRTLASTFGEIRPTFYGEIWDVQNVRESKNIAYTNLDLGLHMDLLYFQHPPRYQILHCLRNRVRGGTSIFVDALHAASTLRKTHPEEFNILTNTPVPFHYINDGHHLHYEHPTIELAKIGSSSSSNFERPISHINYSPPFQAPLLLSTPTSFFSALRRFSELLNDPENTYEYTLKEGDAALFDNRRVLHARTAFYDLEGDEGEAGETNRWLKGCYLEADAIMDRGRVLKGKIERGEV